MGTRPDTVLACVVHLCTTVAKVTRDASLLAYRNSFGEQTSRPRVTHRSDTAILPTDVICDFQASAAAKELLTRSRHAHAKVQSLNWAVCAKEHGEMNDKQLKTATTTRIFNALQRQNTEGAVS